MEEQKTHSSHDVIDVSDVTLYHDLMCAHCHKADEELETPCEANPYWQVTI